MDHPPNHERTYCCQLMLDCYDFLVNMSNMVGWHNMIFKPTPYFFWVFHARSHRACDFCYKKKANHAMTWCFPTTEPTSSWKSGWPDVIRCPNGWLNGGNHGETMVYPAFWCILHTHWMDMAVQTSPGSFRKDEVTPRTLLGQPEEIIKDTEGSEAFWASRDCCAPGIPPLICCFDSMMMRVFCLVLPFLDMKMVVLEGYQFKILLVLKLMSCSASKASVNHPHIYH